MSDFVPIVWTHEQATEYQSHPPPNGHMRPIETEDQEAVVALLVELKLYERYRKRIGGLLWRADNVFCVLNDARKLDDSLPLWLSEKYPECNSTSLDRSMAKMRV